MSNAGKVFCLIILALILGGTYWIHRINVAWEQQPGEVKAAAAQLEHQLDTQAQAGDFIKKTNGSIGLIVFVGDHEIRLVDCVRCDSYIVSPRGLSRNMVVLIPQEDTDAYRDAAVGFVNPQLRKH